jgi:hypothetical protein
MKKTLFASINFILFALIFTSCAPTIEEAMNYNDKIIHEQKKIIGAENDLIRSIKATTLNTTLLDEQYSILSKQIDESTAIVEKIDDFDGKTDFKDATLKLFKIYREVADTDYKAWIKNLKIPSDMLTKEDYAEESVIVARINSKLDNANGDFIYAQKEFASKYKIVLKSDK